MNRNRHILILLVALCGVVAAKVFADSADDNRRKADFIFMEAATAGAEGRSDDRLMLMRRAAALVPDDPFILAAIAEEVLDNRDLRDQALYTEVSRSIIDRYYAEPTILINGQQAIQVAKFLEDTDLELDIYETMHRNIPKNQEVTIGLADAYISKWMRNVEDTVSYRKGMDIFERLVAAAPDNLMYSARLMRPLLYKRDTTAVEQRLEALQTAAPADVNVAVFSAQVYSMLGRDSLVEAVFEHGRAVDPQNGQLLMAMADYYRQKADSAAYDREVFAAMSAPDLDFSVKLPILKDYVVAVYADSVLQPRIDGLFEMVQQTNPGEADLHSLYAQYLTATDRNSDAIDQYNVAVGLNPRSQQDNTELVRLNLVESRYDKAAEAGRRAMEYFPGDLVIATFLSYALAEIDSTAAAISMLEDFPVDVLNERGKGQLYSRLGDLYYLQKESPKAFDAYEKAIIFDPENYMSMNNLAYFYAEADTLLSRAEMYATLAVGNEPDSPTYLDTYAWVLFKQNKYQEAAEQIENALANTYIMESVINCLGEYAPKEYKTVDDDAMRTVSAEILEHAGDIYFFLRDTKKAKAYWKGALELAKPDDEQRLKDKISGKFYFDD